MANEATIRSGLTIRKVSGSLVLMNKNYSAQYQADVDGTKGPTPGAFSVDELGVDVDLSELTAPGWCWVKNLDATNTVEMGAWDPETDRFYPLLKWGPGQEYAIQLSDNLFQEFGDTGTGTVSDSLNTLRFRAVGAGDGPTANVSVEAFEQ